MRTPASCAKYSYSCRIHRNTAGGRRLLDSTSTNNDWSFKLAPSATYNHLPLFGVTRLQKVTTLKVASQAPTASILLYPLFSLSLTACSTWVLSSAKIVISSTLTYRPAVSRRDMPTFTSESSLLWNQLGKPAFECVPSS